MIHFRDATMLALTKLRTRKIRLTVTIVISGLLFSGLAGASLVARGVMHSIDSFSKEGLGSRYIAQAFEQSSYAFMSDQAVIDRAIAIQKDIVARKKVEAKRLGLTYDSATEPQPVQTYDYPGGDKQQNLDTNHPAAKQAIKEYFAAHPTPGKDTFRQTAKPYEPTATYFGRGLPFVTDGSQLQVLKEGKETFESENLFKNGPPTGIDSFVTSWSALSNELLKPFILPGQNLQTGSDGTIPIIVPRTAAEQVLGLKSLPSSASSKDQLERTKEIRQKAPQTTFTACYRNTTSATLVGMAVNTAQEIEKNKTKKDYKKPDLIYGLPTEPCGSVPITRDVRSSEEKKLAEKQRQFDELFGTEPAEQAKLTFRIVGIVPDPNYGSGPAFGVGQIISSLLTSSLGNGWYMPVDQLDTNPLVNKLFSRLTVYGNIESHYAEFASATQARNFIEKEDCVPDYEKIAPGEDPATQCLAKNQPFGVQPYGSNSLALESAKKTFGKFFGLAALAVSAIAGIIMMGTVGRMIADSRRETAVFRAIGAKKLDIAQIYVIYAICLSLLIFVFAITVGFILASVADGKWSAEATIQAITAYNSQDLSKTFSLYSFYPQDILMLLGLTIAAGVISAAFPLIRNLRRNPIRDMRDDT